MNIIRKIINVIRSKPIGHIAYLTLPEEIINKGWYDFIISVDGFNTKHDGSLTVFSGKVKVEAIKQ